MSFEEEENTPEKQINALLEKNRKAINARLDQIAQQFLANAESVEYTLLEQQKLVEVIAYMDKHLTLFSFDLHAMYNEMDLIHTTLGKLVPDYNKLLVKVQKKSKSQIKRLEKKKNAGN